MDAFTEQLITKRKAGKEWAMIALALALAVILVALSAFLFFIIPMLGVLALLAGCYGLYHLIIRQNIEFEYIVTNGDIDIDRIVARRSRKRIVSVAGRKIDMLEPYSAESAAARPYDRTVMAASSVEADGLWMFSYRSKKRGRTLVIFEPNERVLNELLSGLSRPLALEIKQKYAL